MFGGGRGAGVEIGGQKSMVEGVGRLDLDRFEFAAAR
jgi:hypothetical protein